MSLLSRSLQASVMTILAASLAACGGGGGSSSTPAPISSAVIHQTPLLIRDAPSENWASVAVKVVSIALTASDGSSVTVYQPTTPALMNLVQLDQISDALSGAIPAGTYTGANVTLAANPGDVVLTVGQDPEPGFVGTPGSVIPADQTVINGATGASGAMTVSFPVAFKRAVTVSSSQSTPIQLDFNLGHPAFVITHAVTGGATIYTVTFQGGTVFPHPVAKVTDIVLRHLYGTASSVTADNTGIVISREVPMLPITSPETAVSVGTTSTVLADATHGTLYYDLDASNTPTTVTDFSSIAASVTGRQLRVEARYQPDGSMVATRVFSSANFATVWRSPEGHVLRVDPSHSTMTVSGEDGTPVVLTVDASTTFTVPNQTAAIGTGPAFLTNVHRGFKVHVTVDTTTASLANIVEIESAGFSGRIANSSATQFDIQATYRHLADSYDVTLPYIAANTVTDVTFNGSPVTGFSYWNFAYPTEVVSAQAATATTAAVDPIAQFVQATGGSVGFGGIWGPLYARGETHAVWGDPSNPSGWSAPWVDLMPTNTPTAWVSTPIATNQFAISAPGGAVPLTVTFDTTPGSATLVYAVQRSKDAVNVTVQDISSSSGLAAVTTALALNTPVRVSGIPQADGTLKAYAITYFTGTHPTN
jgi:hypothetical protein